MKRENFSRDESDRCNCIGAFGLPVYFEHVADFLYVYGIKAPFDYAASADLQFLNIDFSKMFSNYLQLLIKDKRRE